MKFNNSTINGVLLIESPKTSDDRGFFLKAFNKNAFSAQGLAADIVQLNLSHNNKKGIVRGLHYQTGTSREAKFMRCIRGKIFYVVVDVRKDSPTYLQWEGFTLSEENGLMVYVPEMCATGYQAITDGAQAFYASTNQYMAADEKGIRYNDPAFKINWPIAVEHVSEKDNSWEDFK